MRVALFVCGFSLALTIVAAGPIIKRYADGDINTLNEKLDAFIDAKTRAITALDEGNKAKNAAYGIDNTKSATSEFLGKLISQKIQTGTASIGPLINGATTFISGAASGLTGAFASKLAPLSSLAGGLSGGARETIQTGPEHRYKDGSSGGSDGGGSGNILGSLIPIVSSISSGSPGNGDSGAATDFRAHAVRTRPNGDSGAGSSGGAGGGGSANILGTLIPVVSNVISGSSGNGNTAAGSSGGSGNILGAIIPILSGISGGSSGANGDDSSSSRDLGSDAGAGVNLGGFTNLGGGPSKQ